MEQFPKSQPRPADYTPADPGPAMMALPPRKQLFVMAMIEAGPDITYMRAAHLAGYEAADRSELMKIAYSLSHDPGILAAIKEEAEKHLKANAMLATMAMVEIASNNEHKDRFRAAATILDRVGLAAVEHKEVTVNHTHTTRKSALLELVEIARDMGLDPKVLLGTMSDVVDADFEVVQKALPPPEPDFYGLEDVL